MAKAGTGGVKKKTARKGAGPRSAPKGGAGGGGAGGGPKAVTGKHLVIVESPSKAKTINKYLGPDFVVMASVGHVRDLPAKAAKGDKSPVPGVDLERNFEPTYQVMPGKTKAIGDLKRAAKQAADVWFATDLDREGEAIAWHLAEELGIDPGRAKRVIFQAITKDEITSAFEHPHAIDMDRVNAQQARRILDRIVGYQVSPLLWKKVARGLSAGRVQSVAVRLVAEREREIRAFVPDEYWEVYGEFALSQSEAAKLGPQWRGLLAATDEKGAGPTIKSQNAWLGERGAVRAELVEFRGGKFEMRRDSAGLSFDTPMSSDRTPDVCEVAHAAGLDKIKGGVKENARGKGPARWVRTVGGIIEPGVPYRVRSVETKRTTTRPSPPFITSSLQQAASTRLGFGAQRTMRAAQQLYEGVELPGEGPVGLITYMRTDSTSLSKAALDMARAYIGGQFGQKYLPEKPNFFSSRADAQEAHEAIRPTSLEYPPSRVKNALKPDQFRLYSLIWERFVACQMTPAQWDLTTVMIEGGRDAKPDGSDGACVFRASGRVLVFDGFYRVTGVPAGGDTANLPALDRGRRMYPFGIDVDQKFTSAPPRYTEASLIKTLEAEGIGRPSTYASIIQVIQDRKYVEQLERRFYATDLGEVVTDKLVEAFPRIMDVGYTRQMEADLDRVEEDHLDWTQMLRDFYGPFAESLGRAESELKHAKAEVAPAPKEYRCAKCGSDLVYRFGKNGRFLSCSRYPDCEYACPVDREGRPRQAEVVNVRCPKTGKAMVRKTGRFGPFLATPLDDGQPASEGIILNIDRKGKVAAPSIPPLATDLPCPTCGSPLNLRSGVRGPWLGCSRFPKCRGRGKWAALEEKDREALERRLEEHERAKPVPIIRTLDGKALTDSKGKPLADAPTVEQLVITDDAAEGAEGAGSPEELESVA